MYGNYFGTPKFLRSYDLCSSCSKSGGGENKITYGDLLDKSNYSLTDPSYSPQAVMEFNMTYESIALNLDGKNCDCSSKLRQAKRVYNKWLDRQ